LWTKTRRILKGLLVGLGALIAAQAIYFAVMLNGTDDVSPSEAIVVFRGTEARIAAGYNLARQGVAPLIMISPSSEKLRRARDRRYGLPEGVAHLIEERARTTMENAWQAARIIKERGLTSVTLVTSDYHMPRSLFLMELFLLGQRVDVRPFRVRPAGGRPPNHRVILAKLVYNEAIECWGSLAEWAVWRLTGEPLKTKGKDAARLVAALRDLLLLRVEPLW
jgi:uncharacterized SAM-binding protein YcdF (DUF218 family)